MSFMKPTKGHHNPGVGWAMPILPIKPVAVPYSNSPSLETLRQLLERLRRRSKRKLSTPPRVEARVA